MSLLTPTLYENDVYGITPQKLTALGIKLIIFDIDNTLVPTSTSLPPQKVIDLIKSIKESGIYTAIASNNKKLRVKPFCDALDVEFTWRSGKPLTYAFSKLKRRFGVKRSEMCIAGDQLYMDILGANLYGMKSILVKPVSNIEGLGVRMRRIFEIIPLKKIRPVRLALIGNPVEHSVSPLLHNKIFDKFNINAQYRLYNPQKDELGKLITYFKQHDFKGFNITVPYKQEIMPFLDEISDEAKIIGAVNTVKIKNGKLYGYNTDGEGFIYGIEDKIKDARVKIIGCGGATPSIVHSLIKHGAKEITLYNRTFEKAKELADKFSDFTITPQKLEDFSPADCELLINATSAELLTGKPPIESLEGIDKNTFVADISYKPRTTKFMELAIEQGCKTRNGLSMVIRQGILAELIWFEK